MSKKKWNRILFAVWLAMVSMAIAILLAIGGCSGGQARITEYDAEGNRIRTVVIDPYVLARDVINNGGELWVEVDPKGYIVYWLVLGDHASTVSPENAKMLKETVKAFNPIGGLQ